MTVGAVTERRGDLFGIAAFSDRVETFVRARGGKLHYSACRDAINNLRARPVSPDFEEIATFLRLRLRRRALVIFLTALDDPVLAEHFAALRAAAGATASGDGGDAPPRIRAARCFRMRRSNPPRTSIARSPGIWHGASFANCKAPLARQGVRLALLEPESFAANLVNLYDDVKQRQLL